MKQKERERPIIIESISNRKLQALTANSPQCAIKPKTEICQIARMYIRFQQKHTHMNVRVSNEWMGKENSNYMSKNT